MQDLNTPRLLLRYQSPERIEKIRKASIQEQRRFFGEHHTDDLERIWKKINRRSESETHRFIKWDIVRLEDDEVIGDAVFHNWFPDHARAEIGYKLYEPYRRKGYMQEAVKEMLRFGFSDMQLTRIEACIAPENALSRSLVAKFGFAEEGLLRDHYYVDGKPTDSIIHSLLKREYKAK